MAIEPRRGCGYRKAGGLYLISGGGGRGCGKMPIPLDVCPTCHGGIKPTRGWTWVDPVPLVAERDCNHPPSDCRTRPLRHPAELGRVGLLWIGEKHYSPESFIDEAVRLGVSRRIPAVPKGCAPGTWVLCASQHVQLRDGETGPAAFYAFQVQRIEKVVTESQSRDELEMEKLRQRGITPFVVPDGDKDHNPAANGHDDDQEELF